MSNFEKIQPSIPEESVQEKRTTSLEDFRNKVPEIIAEAQQSGRGGHFSDLFDPNQLDERDMDLYSRYENLNNTSDLGKFIAELQQQAMALKGSNNGSKKEWISYILNRIQDNIDIRK